MKFLRIFALVIFTAAAAFAQDGVTVSGLIMAADVPLANASVTLKSKKNEIRTTTSDAGGRYSFENVQPGEYEITATLNVVVTKIITVGKGQPLTVDMDLRLDGRRSGVPFIAEFVTISADANQTPDQVSKTVNVINGQEMRDRADFTLVDTLRTVPGFRVQQLGGFGRTASIKSRGLRNQDTAVLIDGVRFRDAASITGDATPFLSDFTLTSVRRVEVLRGPGSSLYGTNAIGGTLDFQTPTPESGFHGQVSGAAGGLGLGRFRTNLGYGTDDGKFGVIGGISRTAYTKGIDDNDNASNTGFQSRIELQPFQTTHISARFFVSDAKVRLNSSPARIGIHPLSTIIDADEGINFRPDADDPDDIQESDFFNGQVVFTQLIGSELLLQASYSGLKTTRENMTGPLGVGFQFTSASVFEGLINTANASLHWFPNAANRLTIGYEFENERFFNDNTSEFGGDLTTHGRQSSNTLYAQHLVSLFDQRLQLAGGVRAQFFDLENPTFSSPSPLQNLTLDNPPSAYTFDGSASYLFKSTGTKFRAHVGNGYRVPSLFERFSSFFGAVNFMQLFLAGAPDLEPERSVGFDAGVEQNLFNRRLLLTGTYFYTDLSKAIGYGFLPQPDRFGRVNAETFGGYLNTDGLIARGGEFTASIRPTSSTDIFTSYTYTNSDQRTPQAEGTGVISSLGVPDHQFTAVVTQRIKRFWASFDFVATSSYLAPLGFPSNVYRFGGGRRADLTAGYTFPINEDRMNLRVFGTIENLFDHQYFENGFRTVGRNGRIGVSFGF